MSAAAPSSADARARVPGQCSFWMSKKGRFCRFTVGPNTLLCAEHSGADDRIKCPLDPSHTVSQAQLSRHLLKCNARPKPPPHYHVQHVNAPRVDTEAAESKPALASVPIEELRELIQRVQMVVSTLLPTPLETKICEDSVVQQAIESHSVPGKHVAFKHFEQQSSLIGLLKHMNLLLPSSTYVEFGAGKG